MKRKPKKGVPHRPKSISPSHQPRSDGEAECYIDTDWHTDGMATILVLRKAPDGGYAMAGFMVDLWCCGLKDAWGRLDITREEFHKEMLESLSERLEIQECDCNLAKRLIAGGIRVAHENGFTLPLRYERWASVLGVKDQDDADLSDFGTGADPPGAYVGTMADLTKRLVGPLKAFLERR